jgi:hypothetical protein
MNDMTTGEISPESKAALEIEKNAILKLAEQDKSTDPIIGDLYCNNPRLLLDDKLDLGATRVVDGIVDEFEERELEDVSGALG